MHCPFSSKKDGSRESGSELDMKYATQSMEYEVRSMKRAGKSVAKSVEEQGRAREERGKRNKGFGYPGRTASSCTFLTIVGLQQTDAK